MRPAIDHGILDTDCGTDCKKRQAKFFASNGRAHQCQNHVQSDGAQKCALSRHVRSADDKKPRRVAQLEVVPYAGCFVEEWMTQSFRLQHMTVFCEDWNRVSGVLI